MGRSIKTEAIVLKKKSLSNQDAVITLLSKDLGKVTAFAKGIKKITSRRLPHTQTANLIEAMLYKKNENFYLQDSNLKTGFSQIKRDQGKLEQLYQFLFVLERLLPDNQEDNQIFKLTLDFLIKLSKNKKLEVMFLNQYLNKLLILQGYANEALSHDELFAAIEEIIHEKIPEVQL